MVSPSFSRARAIRDLVKGVMGFSAGQQGVADDKMETPEVNVMETV